MTDEELESALQYQYDIGYDEGYQAARDELEDEMRQLRLQGEADGACLAALTRGKMEWVTEDETACQDWEEA